MWPLKVYILRLHPGLASGLGLPLLGTKPVKHSLSQPKLKPFLGMVGALWLSSVNAVLIGDRAIAQSLPTCQSPRPNEYLLLVVNQQADTRSQLQAILPSNAVLTICDYLGTNVVRVESFASTEVANAWAQYLNDIAGMQTFVARPSSPIATSENPASATGGTTSAPPLTTAPSSAAFNPQALGAGYAVVVNYFNRPEVATDVHQITTREVGLVSFQQRPYLLAAHTTDANVASAILKQLSDRGFTAAIVDSRQVILLTPAVVGTRSN